MLEIAFRSCVSLTLVGLCSVVIAQEKSATSEPTKDVHAGAEHRGPECLRTDRFFADEVWAKVGERNCLKCHNAKGDASESQFLLEDTARDRNTRDDALRHNRLAFQQVAIATEEGQSRLLLKIAGALDHGGGEVLKPDSTGYRILKRFVRRASGGPDDVPAVPDYDAPPFFDRIAMLSPRRLLRRVTLSLAGRLPTEQELAAVDKGGLKAVDAALDSVLQKDAFYERLQEAFNDILLTRGYDGNGEEVLSYDHFKSRLWYQERDPRKAADGDKKLPYSHPEMVEYTKLIADYREGLLREPLELITYLVRNERPFTEIVTADYTMVSPYTARGYDIFEELKDKFDDPDDPYEFIPARIPALQSRNGRQKQESETGFYPHAGLLSSFQYLKRYPTTETNRNRLRVRMYFEHFLGIDIMQLAPRVNDAAAITAKYEIPTMQAADCVVCHKVIDPIAGLYQDFYALDGKGIYGPRKDGWYEDMFSAGFETEDLPSEEQWRSLQWLGERTVRDPRFATTMVEHVWRILSGRKPLLPPEDIDDPMFSARRRAYREQRDEIEQIASRFIAADYNLKVVFKELVQSKFYRADGLAAAVNDPRRMAELDDVGVVRLLSPEQLERKIVAVFGQSWGGLKKNYTKIDILYGGIDSKQITERMATPSGAMGAIQRIMANEVACRNVALDFSREPEQRHLFPNIEPTVVPSDDPSANKQIRQAIVFLHDRILGVEHAADDPEVERTFQLFTGIIEDARAHEGISGDESYYCRVNSETRLADPIYTYRAWRGVVTYLLRQQDFLYE